MSSVWYPAILVLLLQAGYITASVRWPYGSYGLLKPKTGCPDAWTNNGGEVNGSIHEEAPRSNPSNDWSHPLNIAGFVRPMSVEIYFCIHKLSSRAGAQRPPWPKGIYCVYSNDDWMHGMQKRYITKYRRNNYYSPSDFKNGFSNVGSYYITIHFACQTKGDKKIPIELPITKPFYLLPYGSHDCQQVKWMVATTEWIQYYTQYGIDSDGKQLPYHKYDSHDKGLTMYYCYYKSCNYTLTETKGVFQSPSFPGKYPDGQLCSWRIMVPANHTVHVTFTNVSMYDYDKDCLQLYEHSNNMFKPKQAFFGHQQPFNITATRDLMFVFRSDEENNSTGFRAEYKILKIPGCNYTLTEKKGVFQFSDFPGIYPDGQLCSWRIMVPVNHTVQVNFTTFSLYEYDEDCLQLYENNTRIVKPKQAFFGHQQPFNITATRDLMFVFRSDEEKYGTGFRAEYEISEITTTAKPPPTTTIPTTEKTTTTQPTTRLVTTKLPNNKQPATEPRTSKLQTKGTTSSFIKTNVNSTTNDTVRFRPTSNNHKSSNNQDVHSSKKTCLCDETWRIVVMVIPLIGLILIVVVTIGIFCRYRYRNASKSGTRGSVDEGMVVNQTYERGDIIVDQPTNPTTDDSTLNTVDDQQPSRDEPPDYEDVDYTQLNEVPPPNRGTSYPECHALQSVGNDAPEVLYHVLEPPTAGLDIQTYQNLSEVNHYNLNPVYDSAENSAPLFEVNQHYDQYMA